MKNSYGGRPSKTQPGFDKFGGLCIHFFDGTFENPVC